LQLDFDCEPWAPTLPDVFVVVPRRNSAIAQRLREAVPIRQTKNNRAVRDICPYISGKIPEIVTEYRRKKTVRSDCLGRGKVNVVGSTAPPIETYHCAMGWKNSTVWTGRSPGRELPEFASDQRVLA
jgi:hypothetical protein